MSTEATGPAVEKAALQNSIQKAKLSRVPLDLANAQNALAVWFIRPQSEKSPKEAIPLFENAAPIYLSAGQTIDSASCYSNLAHCYSAIGINETDPKNAVNNYRMAIDCSSTAIILYGETRSNDFYMARHRKTIALQKIGQLTSKTDPQEAREHFEQAMAMNEENKVLRPDNEEAWQRNIEAIKIEMRNALGTEI